MYSFYCHDIALLQAFAHEIAVMYLGNVLEVLPGEKLKDSAYHPYTKALLSSLFSINMDFSEKIASIEGDVPSPINLPSGCVFQGRCKYVKETSRADVASSQTKTSGSNDKALAIPILCFCPPLIF